VTPASFKTAFSESEVVAEVRKRLAALRPDEIARLPQHCRPEEIRDTEDIANLAFNLTTTRIESTWPQELLVELDRLFADACQRVTEIQTTRIHAPSKNYRTND
jgi:hypothetical protein